MGEGRFEGRVAVVTGGASGIGREIACRLVAEGAQVAIGDVDEPGLEAVVGEVGDAAVGIPTDVSVEHDVAALVEAAAARFGAVHVACNVAGAGAGGPLVGVDRAHWDAAVAVTLTGTFLSIKHEAPALAAAGGGAIVNISSINSFQAAHGAGPYCAAKAGVAMLTKSGALELAADRIRVNAVAPGLVDTPMTAFQREIPAIREAYLDVIPLARVGRTADISAAVLFLASDDAEWITGVELTVDGGETLTGYPNLTRLFAAASAEFPETDTPTARTEGHSR